MSLVSGTGSISKIKAIVCALEGFASDKTCVYGGGADINCEDVEYLSIGMPDTDENQSVEFETNKRKIKDSIENDGFKDWDKMTVVNDENHVNWKAFLAAKITGAVGTVTLKKGTDIVHSWKAKVANVEGGSGDAGSLDTSFKPTFKLLEALK